MSNENEIVVRVNPSLRSDGGQFFATLEYYMENNPRQQEWREVPGWVPGVTEEEVMAKANAMAVELDKLDLFALKPAVQQLLKSGQLVVKPIASA
jgi:hypothetical protein